MTVAVDGVVRYHWPVSSGNPSHETPNGSFRTFRMEADHFSKEFDDAPMPHSIFFTREGHAIHGTGSEGQLGSPVSHGCVRLSRANASTLYALVEEQGVLNTTVTLTGSSQVALARNPRGRANTAVARRDPADADAQQFYNAAGDPVVLTPRQPATGPVSAGAAGRRLHLSGRRQPGRHALSGAATGGPAPLRRAGLSAAAAAILRQRPAGLRAASLCTAAQLPAARTVHLSGLNARTSVIGGFPAPQPPDGRPSPSTPV